MTTFEDQVVGMGGQQKAGKVNDTKKKQVVKHFIANWLLGSRSIT